MPASCAIAAPPCENAFQYLQIECFHGKRRNVERADGRAAHRIDVGECIGRRDASEVIWIVDDGREKVDGLHDCKIVAQFVHARVVGRAEPDEDVFVRGGGQVAQDLRQLGRAEFTRSTRAGREFGEPDFGEIHVDVA